jgi:hypothetical protein
MLLQNGINLGSLPLTQTGGTLAGEAVWLGLRDQTFAATYSGAFSNTIAVGGGYAPGDAWYPAIKQGGIGAYADMSLAYSASAAIGINLDSTASLVLSANANAVGVVSMAAAGSLDLTGSAGASALVFRDATSAMELTATADASAAANMVASGPMSLSGSASIDASVPISANGSMSLSGTSTVSVAVSLEASGAIDLSGAGVAIGSYYLSAAGSSSLTGSIEGGSLSFIACSGSASLTGSATMGSLAWMIASAGGPAELSPEGLASAVWSAIANDNDVPGTMGAKLNGAASAGDPWSTTVPGIYPAGSAGYLMGQLALDDPGLEASIAMAVWSAIANDNDSPGTMGEKLNEANSAGDPWSTTVPGAYPAGSAGYLMGQLALDDPDLAVRIADVWKRLGLDPASPLVHTASAITAGPGVQIGVATTGTSSTLTRA